MYFKILDFIEIIFKMLTILVITRKSDEKVNKQGYIRLQRYQGVVKSDRSKDYQCTQNNMYHVYSGDIYGYPPLITHVGSIICMDN